MLQTKTVDYFDTELEVCACLADLWPVRLHYERWPSFCGAGNGFGDWIIPEEIVGVRVACICFDHDVSWAISEDTVTAALDANWRMYKNLRKFVLANYNPNRFGKTYAEFKCFAYFVGVCIGIRKSFSPDSPKTENPLHSPTVKNRLHRLAMATLDGPKFYTERNFSNDN